MSTSRWSRLGRAVVASRAPFAAGVSVLCIAILAACPSASLDQRERAIFASWLVCFDCGSQLDSVRAIARRKPAPSVAELDRALVEGPPASSISDSMLVQAFVRDSLWRLGQSIPRSDLSRPEYIADQRRRLGGGYQTRGAIGLGWIHDSAAVAALEKALTLPLPPAVHDAVRFAIDSLPRNR